MSSLLELLAPGNTDRDPARFGRYDSLHPPAVNADSTESVPPRPIFFTRTVLLGR
jgi:hypothetical protein